MCTLYSKYTPARNLQKKMTIRPIIYIKAKKYVLKIEGSHYCQQGRCSLVLPTALFCLIKTSSFFYESVMFFLEVDNRNAEIWSLKMCQISFKPIYNYKYSIEPECIILWQKYSNMNKV
jgi:hypothetical protein